MTVELDHTIVCARDTGEARSTFDRRVSEMLQMIAASAEYQYC